MPAAVVIPAPIAYIKAVAVKKLVVGYQCVFTSGMPGSWLRRCLVFATKWRSASGRASKYRLTAFKRAGFGDGPLFRGAC